MAVINIENKNILLQNHDYRTEEETEKYNNEKLMAPFIVNFGKIDVIYNGDSLFCDDKDNIDLEKFFIKESKFLTDEMVEIPFLEKFGDKKDFLLSLARIKIFKIKGKQLLPSLDKDGTLNLSEGNVFFLINTNRLISVRLNKTNQEKLDDKSMIERGIISDMISLNFMFEGRIENINIFKEEWIKWKANHIS